MATPGISHNTGGDSRRNALISLGLRSITAGIFLLAAFLLLNRFLTVQSWPTARGVVEFLTIETVGDPEDSRSPGQQARPNVTYRYTVDNQEYTGSTMSAFPWVYRNDDRVVTYLEQHRISLHETVPVHYNPKDPSESILVPDIPWNRLEVILAVVFLVLLPVTIVVTSFVDFLRGGVTRKDDHSRGRFW
jgi:hypothetical protein